MLQIQNTVNTVIPSYYAGVEVIKLYIKNRVIRGLRYKGAAFIYSNNKNNWFLCQEKLL